MKFKSLLVSLLAFTAIAVGCKKSEAPIQDIVINVTPSSLNMDSRTQDVSLAVTATRAWKATITYEGDVENWLTLSPDKGAASTQQQNVTITVKENTGRDRVAKVKFSIGLDDQTVTVTQAGPGGSADPVYYNDFDKAAAVKDGNNWPYVYQSECWKNEKGTGVSTVKYVTDGNKATVRNNNNSSGSGVNNWFFGKSPAFFCVKNITLPSATNYVISFAGLRNVYDAPAGGSIFDHSLFKLYISNDGSKWVELEYHFPNGDPDNAWDNASSTFTVPAGTKTLCIGVPTPGEASTFRMDDLKLDVSEAAGKSIDFSTGIEISEFAGGGDTPVTPGVPSGTGTQADPYNATAAYQKAAALPADQVTEDFYYIKGYIKEVASVDVSSYGNANFYITDAKDGNTEKFYCFQIMYLNGEKFSSADQIKAGDEVVVYAQLVNYRGNTPETNGKGSGKLISINGKGGGDTPVPEITTESVADILAASKGTKATLKNAVVVATAKTGYLVTDAGKKDFVFVFEDKAPKETLPAVGDKVDVVATVDIYSNMPQLTTPTTTVLSSGTAVEYPSPEDITSSLSTFTSTKVKYVSITGKLSIEGDYYNIAVNGSTVKGAFVPPVIDVTSFVGLDSITYEGYYIYTTGSSTRYVYLILTSAKPLEGDYFMVSPTEISVAATATGATINVSSTVDWTAASSSADFTVSPASGSKDGKINVTFAANTSENSRSTVITVATSSDKVSKKSYTVTLTQKGVSSGDEFESTVTWKLGSNAYDKTSSGSSAQSGTVNGQEVSNMLKLGTSSKKGDAKLVLPAGTSKVSFYCVSWKGKNNVKILLTAGSKEISQPVASNDGASGNPPYTMTVTDADHYTIDLGTTLTAETEVSVTTADASRVIFFGINAQ